MELAEYWMLMKRRDLFLRSSSHLRDTALRPSMSIGDSWEEKAFAEDAAGSLGSIWPPRSYSCTFCNREFRSAQALGGHMNVHRRDRARLKQSISTQSEIVHNPDENQTIPSSFCSLDSNYYCHHKPDLNSDPSTNTVAPPSISPVPTSRVIPTFSSSHVNGHTSVSSCNDLILPQGHQKHLVKHPSWSDSPMSARRVFEQPDAPKIQGEKKLSGVSIYGDHAYQKTKLSVGLTSTFNGYPPTAESASGEERISSKRPKTISTSLSPLLQPCSLVSSCPVKSEINGVKVSSMDDLDLELRLGDTPKVK